MDDRFEKLTTNVAQIHKSIQKIKKIYMQSQGLKSTHVMCLYYLSDHPDGLTAAGLCELCKEDKAGISRILNDLESRNFIAYEATGATHRYRSRAHLTDAGMACAREMRSFISHALEEASKDIAEPQRKIFYKTLFTIADNLEHLSQELCK